MPSSVALNEPPDVFDWEQTDLYRFFAFALGSPSPERHQWFSQAGAAEAMGGLWSQLSKKKFPGFRWFRDYSDYEAAYISAFEVGAPEPPVPLFESAHNKTRPAQELALENTYFYDVFGLKVDPGLSVPDHLLTQLEFLSAVAFTREHGSDGPHRSELAQLERDFLRRHLLSWTPKAEVKIRLCPFPAFRVLFSLMTLHLRRRLRLLSA